MAGLAKLGGDSPHPRGWTPGQPGRPWDVDGFPAPAGMDRRSDTGLRRSLRIPRTRGDGPERGVGTGARIPDSPHPRGWTRLRRKQLTDEQGFPAPAGMDPRQPRRWLPRGGIPRTRGDGPGRWDRGAGAPADSPHPRGWTGVGRDHGRRRQGFPAPAGMDPEQGAPVRRHQGIPRTRGDGPAALLAVAAARADSPHPRGWTREHDRIEADAEGFPAPAGMDRRSRRLSRPRGRIPRTRGDGPSSPSSAIAATRDSPHPRGWTPYRGCPTTRRLGFPAPAGMDPAIIAHAQAVAGIPRTRGDGPYPPLPLSTCA